MRQKMLGWTENYVRYKDSFYKRIIKIDIDAENDILIITMKDGKTEKYVCTEYLSEPELEGIDKIITLNNRRNIEWLIGNWQKVKEKNVMFIFTNPHSNMSWAIKPKLHDLVTEEESLASGIISMFESVPEA